MSSFLLILQELADEFSHTVMHGCKVKRALPPGANLPQPVRVMKPTPGKPCSHSF